MEKAKEAIDNSKVEVKGALNESLSRSNKQIRQERGDAIAEDMEMSFKREVEDLEMKIKRKTRDKLNMIDFSPTNAQSLVMGKDVDAHEIKDQILKIRLEIRNLNIRLNLAKEEYEFLFGIKL